MKVHIAGCGVVGFWLTVGLSRIPEHRELVCWDDDDLQGGFGRLRLPHAEAETKKIDLLRGFLSMAMGADQLPTFHANKFTGLKELNKGDLVVDCTDMNLEAKKKLYATIRRKEATVLRVSYDGKASTILVSSGLPFMGAKGGYENIPSLALSFAAGGVGAEIVTRYLKNPIEHFEFVASLGDIIPLKEENDVQSRDH